MDWKWDAQLKCYGNSPLYPEEKITVRDWEEVYQQFKKRLKRDRKDDDKPVKTGWIYPPVRFDPVNFGTVVINARKTPCEHIESVEVGISTITTYYSAYFAYCPDCGEKL